jgi:hypothetical protein
MAVTRDFIVKLIADPKELLKGFADIGDRAKAIFGGAEADIQKLVPSIAAVTAASAAAFAGLAAFATKATQAAIEDQAEQERLAQTLQKVVGATDEAVASTEKFIAGLAKTTTFSDSQLRPALSSLVVATGDLTRAQDLLTVAQDISIATGTDLQQVSDALAKASNGNNKALQALSPTLRDNIKEGQSFDQVLRELQANFGGAAQAAGQTLSGQMTILRNRFNEVVESIGAAFLPILEELVVALGFVATFIENNTTLVIFLTSSLLAMTGVITAVVAVWGAYKGALALASAANAVFGASLTATGIGAIIVLIGLLVGAFVTLVAKTGSVSNAFKTMGNFLIMVWEQATNNILIGVNFVIDALNLITSPLRKIGIDIGTIDKIAPVAFGRMELSAKDAADGVDQIRVRLEQTSGVLQRFVSGVQAENRARMASQGALDKYNESVRKQISAGAGAAEKTKTAADKLKEYTQVLKSAQQASKAFGDAQKRTSRAQQSVAEADKAVADAQAALLKAQQAGSPAEIADAQRAVAAAERGLARAKFGQEEAIMAVRDAERKLADVRQDPTSTPDAIRRAEIDLAEAKFAVADAEDNQIDVANKLNEARRQLRIATTGLAEGDRELVPLQDAVTKAQERQREAADAYTEALENQAEALENYKTALQELADVAKNFPKIAANVGQPGLIPTVPTPAATGMMQMPDTAQQAPIIVNVTAGIGGNAYQVGKEIIEVLDQYTSVAGPLDTLMRVA